MKVLDPGHRYELRGGNGLVFLQKEGGKVIRDGTTNEELVEVLIDRVTEACRDLPCEESIRAVYLLRQALEAFHMRAAKRFHAKVEGTHQPHYVVLEPVNVSHSRPEATDFDQADFGARLSCHGAIAAWQHLAWSMPPGSPNCRPPVQLIPDVAPRLPIVALDLAHALPPEISALVANLNAVVAALANLHDDELAAAGRDHRRRPAGRTGTHGMD